MKYVLILILLSGTSVLGRNVCKNTCVGEGHYTEIVVRKTEKCPSEMPEIKTIQRRASQTYDKEERGVKSYSLKKQAKELCKKIAKLEKTIVKGLVSMNFIY